MAGASRCAVARRVHTKCSSACSPALACPRPRVVPQGGTPGGCAPPTPTHSCLPLPPYTTLPPPCCLLLSPRRARTTRRVCPSISHPLVPPPLPPAASEDHEKGVLTRLKQQCGAQFTSKVGRRLPGQGGVGSAGLTRGTALAPAQLVCPSLAACFCACGAVSCIRQHLTTCFPSLCRCLWADGGHGERPAAGQGAREGVRG